MTKLHRIKTACVFLILFSLEMQAVAQSETTFEKRKNDWLNNNGIGFEHCGQAIWAWLENNDQTKASEVSEIINAWATRTTFGDWGEYCYHWRTGADVTCVLLLRILYQYGDRISLEDYEYLENKFDNTIRSSNFFHRGSTNNRLFDFSARYLYSQHHQDIEVQYREQGDQLVDTFTYQGHTYIPGNTYNSYEIARDWLYWTFDKWVETGDREFDSDYTTAFVLCLYTLYDFARDSDMKRKAKTMLDLVLLDSILDVSANLHGGWIGRTYGHQILQGKPKIGWWFYWGLGNEPGRSVWGMHYDAFVSDYRLPALIEDLGVLTDEPDNYWHINKENNYANFLSTSEGKWNYVTKYYNLGGSNRGWMLNVKTKDNNQESGIRLWINDEESIGETGPHDHPSEEKYINLGKNGYQYKNSMLIKLKNPYIHFAVSEGTFDIDEIISGWRFLKEDKVAIAIKMSPFTSALEVAIIGVDYSSYEQFKNAVINNAKVSNGSFTTSRDDVIMSSQGSDGIHMTYVNGEPVWQFPFKRIETEAYTGDKIVSWQNKVMTVKWHGREIIYNFNNWTYSEDGAPLDTSPPGAPTGVRVKEVVL